ncbi:Transcription initiation factor TFIID subunit 6 [Gracilariopsis chorda]|uniref:Transcription initiation factor TFIID subunit 6 n=1 Tax=Gracilariopsis chorda TaxID=448386 RepID=A0A2V3IY80_9FLOR|nr:Transcription initiation factor TFIID subunit 6 [Gracilariopsis chorda]|eukprot:PXF46637.1 Transcription initiation factor TFIID subunit 6 [Gracilariopsis chorda]
MKSPSLAAPKHTSRPTTEAVKQEPAASKAQSSLPQSHTEKSPPSRASKSVEPNRIDMESIRVIAQTIPSMLPLTDPSASLLALDIEYRIREAVQDALKFMKHSKRNILNTVDINAALRMRNAPPIVGFGKPRGNSHKATTGSGTPAGKQKGYAEAGRVDGSTQAFFKAVEGIEDLYFVPDKQKTVTSIIETNIPLVPLDVSLTRHWLTIDGKQPTIPQNPKRSRPVSMGESADAEPVAKKQKTACEVKPLVKHELSRELQLYLEQITTAVQGDDTKHLEQCLYAVANEKGIAELLPYFTQFLYKCVTKGGSLALMFSCLRLVNAMLDNDVFDLRLYLHQVLPAVLTCMLAKRFSGNPRENHWAIRDYASKVVKKICQRYGNQYPDIQPRITKTCASALDNPKRPMTTHYGAIVGLAALGHRVVERHLLPRLEKKAYMRTLERLITNHATKSIRKEEASRVFGALVWAVSLARDSQAQSPEDLSNVQVQVNHALSYLPSAVAVFQVGQKVLGEKPLFPHSDGMTDAELTSDLLKASKVSR